MKKYFGEDPVYKERFSQVWLWSEWASIQPGFDGADTGIDLVAEEPCDLLTMKRRSSPSTSM